ncbi:hypothetical protein FRB99_005113 [Tulasnella sp. 403]|nr:hypothetical protein FRB99_005113 [Tulasnella sp. 403]
MFVAPALPLLLAATTATASVILANRQAVTVDACPGYSAKNVTSGKGTLSADLTLAGTACNAYGPDLTDLKLTVTYENANRIHVKIVDANSQRYEVPDVVFKRPDVNPLDSKSADINFEYTTSPFSFQIYRTKTGETLFDSSAGSLVFEPQYLRLKTHVPSQANIFGLGEHTDPFRFDPTNTTRTLWNRDAYGVPPGTNLYGSHPIYVEHRLTGTHGVLLMNSNGMDIKLTDGALEYNIIGGVFDFYFFSGPSPQNVAQQYAQLVGLPAEVPYWGFGFHQCRYGYRDYVDVANVITNYSAANIPLETMWTDIDYMKSRWTFTNDPDYFPMDEFHVITDYLHKHNQHYIVMIDPAVAYQPNQNYGTYDRGIQNDAFLKHYWTGEIQRFFDPTTGIDVDGLWIDMNEAASFCPYPCWDPAAFALQNGDPPKRPAPPPAKGTPIFTKRDVPSGPDVLNPPYAIGNVLPHLSDNTINVDVVHQNGLLEYDTHNLYGTMMSAVTRDGMSKRRPGLRTLIITRSTFAGAGAKVGKWLGDNLSDWDHYRLSIAGQLAMAAIYQVPMVGSDICGFGGNTTETLCARWAMLGAFSPFMRNHNGDTSISQEFYLWPSVAQAARNAIGIRYQLLDYIYTHFHRQSVDGTPLIAPLWYFYPQDQTTFGIDLQFFYGDYVLVSPVTQENATNVDVYFPKDVYYDFYTYAPVRTTGTTVSLMGIDFTDIPLHIRGGGIIPMRSESAMTTTDLRKKDFTIVVAPGTDGTATGSLYIDDGVSLEQQKTTDVSFTYQKNVLKAEGKFDWDGDGKTKVSRILFLGVPTRPTVVAVSGGATNGFTYDANSKVVNATVDIPLVRAASKGGFSVTFK